MTFPSEVRATARTQHIGRCRELRCQEGPLRGCGDSSTRDSITESPVESDARGRVLELTRNAQHSAHGREEYEQLRRLGGERGFREDVVEHECGLEVGLENRCVQRTVAQSDDLFLEHPRGISVPVQ